VLFNFLNLNAGWIHRLDRGQWKRPFRAPTWILAAGTLLSFVNLALMGLGADVYGAGALRTGLVCASLIIPVFLFRHYIQDKGVFPKTMSEDLELNDDQALVKRAGKLPYIVLAAGAAVVWFAHSLAVT
jgi:hypothetical protein